MDAGKLQRVVLDEGAAVEVRGARSAYLRRPLDLPALPQPFLANVLGVKMADGKVPTQGPLSGAALWHSAAEQGPRIYICTCEFPVVMGTFGQAGRGERTS